MQTVGAMIHQNLALIGRARSLLDALHVAWKAEGSWGHWTTLDMLFLPQEDETVVSSASGEERMARAALQALASAVGWEKST